MLQLMGNLKEDWGGAPVIGEDILLIVKVAWLQIDFHPSSAIISLCLAAKEMLPQDGGDPAC